MTPDEATLAPYVEGLETVRRGHAYDAPYPDAVLVDLGLHLIPICVMAYLYARLWIRTSALGRRVRALERGET